LANKRGAPGGIISLQGGGIIQEALGAIIPLQTGGFVGIGSPAFREKALTEAGRKRWFFITADCAFGKDIEASCAAAVKTAGGDVVGSNTPDFSSFVLQAQNSGADVVALANAGGDWTFRA
jgi:Periplasmic binding protein